MKYLIVGLGNVGVAYELTRHNIGFLTLDRVADMKSARFETARLADIMAIKHRGRMLHFIKPATLMNLSGKAMAYWMKALKIPLENVLVLVDDIALPFGQVRMRKGGSSAGHNGLAHIETTVGTQGYGRIRLGIGNDFSKGGQVDYVLGNFSPEQLEKLPDMMDLAIEMIWSFVTAGPDRTMSAFNRKVN